MSRLRKMILINTKNSGNTCSGRITEIDPRDGAAITGRNGAGKTTTLQLLPLFFGFSPNQIAPVGENRESMLRFVLSAPESSLAFEYQRSDEPEDICLVVLRRHSQTDAAEYRFFEGPFRKEYFVVQDPEGEAVFFLDDAGSVEAATKLGCAPSGKHTSAQYRNVILNTIGVGKESTSRRNEARRFSFNKRRLPFLDRLVAAVVKEHINFSDFTDVAATIVTDRMGGVGRTANGKYPQLRQSKEQIERWLRDREGAERALKLKPVIEGLRASLADNQQQEIVLGQRRADVQHLRRLNERSRDQSKADLERVENQRRDAVVAFELENKRLEFLIDAAKDAERHADNLFRSLKTQKRHLEDNDANEWAKKAKLLPSLLVERSSKQELINSLQERARGIAQQYDVLIIQKREVTANTVAKMKDGKTAISEQYDADITALAEQEIDALRGIEESFKEKEVTAEELVENLREQVAEANYRRQNPAVAPEIEDRLAQARSIWQNHLEEQTTEQAKVAALSKQLQETLARWNTLELQIAQQNRRVKDTADVLAQARLRAKPADGSFHAALLSSDNEAWRQTLARLIDPSLLSRTDLHAHIVDDGMSMYGWALNVDAIDAPGWIQQDVLDNEVQASKYAHENAKTTLAELEVLFEKTEESRRLVQAGHSRQESLLNIILARSPGLKAELKGREEGRIAAIKSAKTIADQNHDTASGKLETAKAQLNRIKAERESALRSERREFSDARSQAQLRRNSKFNDIDESIKRFQGSQAEVIKELEYARDKDLSKAGVDTVVLNKAKKEYDHLTSTISDIQSHINLVREWDEWIETQGQSRYIDADVKLRRAQDAVMEANEKHRLLSRSHRDKVSELNREEIKCNKSIGVSNNDIDILNSIDRTLADFPASGISNLTGNTQASELKGLCQSQLEKLEQIRRDVHIKLQRIERELCEVECSTKDFVNGVMNEGGQDGSELSRAEKMVRLYDRIPREVVVNVNTSLSTILANISEYRKTILTFESEVKRFNKDLQDGLKKVSQNFDRFSDFTASVVTDFDKIDFIGTLKLLDEVVIEHKAQHQATFSIEVPPASTAEALRTFMMALASGTMEIDLSKHITLSGSVTDDGNFKTFHSETQLEQISSNGLTAIALISLLCGLLNVIRGNESIYIPWATDEVGRFDPENFKKLMTMLKDNKIDPVTASPSLTPAAYRSFAKRYLFKEGGVIAEYKARERASSTPMENVEVAGVVG